MVEVAGEARSRDAHTVAWAEANWENVRRGLVVLGFPGDQEPEWFGPGVAYYYDPRDGQRTVQGMPADSAETIARYLRKGFLLRPPAVELSGAASSAAGPSASPRTRKLWPCTRPECEKRIPFRTRRTLENHMTSHARQDAAEAKRQRIHDERHRRRDA